MPKKIVWLVTILKNDETWLVEIRKPGPVIEQLPFQSKRSAEAYVESLKMDRELQIRIMAGAAD